MATDHNFKVKNGLHVEGANTKIIDAGSGNAKLETGGTLSIRPEGTTSNKHFFELNDYTAAGTIQGATLTATGNITGADNVNLKLGTGNDLLLFHDGSHSFVHHNGTGSLKIKEGSADAIEIDGGAVSLNNAGSLRLNTQSTGVKVYGPHGEVSIGALNTTGLHIYTDRGRFYFNKRISLIDNTLTSYDGDLQLKRVDSTKLTLTSTGASVTGNLTISGNLTVSGDTITANVATLDVEDKNITLNKGSGDTSSTADGAGITIQDAVNSTTDATILWDATNDEFDFSHPIKVAGSIGVTNIVTNKVVKFNGSVLDDSNITDTGSLITLGSATTISSGDLTIPSKIRHSGDTDNYIGFGTDTQSFVTGNSTRAQFSNSLVRFNQEGLNQDFQIFGENIDNLFFVDASADRIGIRTSGGTAPLTVSGGDDTASTGVLELATSGGTNLKLGGNTSYSWIQSHASKPLYINQLGNDVILNSGGGDVAIGSTSTPAAIKLYVNGAMRVDGAEGVAAKKIRSSYFSTSQDLTLETHSSSDIIMSTGNVGIGTTSPGSKLHISNNAAPADDLTLLTLQNGNGTGDISTPNTFIDFHFKDSNPNVTPQVRIGAHAGDGGDADSQVKEGKGYLTFHTSDTTAESGTGTPGERMRIQHDGDVGIGTNNPPYRLSVHHATTNVVGSFTSGDNQVWINLNDDGGGTYGALLGHDSDAGDLFTVANDSVTKVLRLTSAGNLTLTGTITTGGDITIPNDDNINFLNSSAANDGTRITRAGGNALRIKYTGNSMILDALGNNPFQVRNAEDEEIFIVTPNNTPTSSSVDVKGALKINGTNRINSVGDGLFTSLYIGGTNVIDTSRNLTNIGTYSGTGAMTVTGSSITVDPASGDASLVLAGAAGAQTLRIDQNSIRSTTSSDISIFTSGNTRQLFLDQSSGNTGINMGSDDPAATLHIKDVGNNTVTSFRTNSMFSVSGDGVVHWGSGAPSGGHGQLTWDTGKAYVRGQSGKALHLGGGGRANDIVINTSGLVGINNSSPSIGVDISRNVLITANDTSNHSFEVKRASDGAQALRINQSGEVVVSNNYLYCTGSGQSLYVQNGAVFRGNISNDGGDVTINDALQVNSNVTSTGRGTFVGDGAVGPNALNLLSSTNGNGVGITFTDNGSPPAANTGQRGNLLYYHGDGASYGSGNAFVFDSTETTLTVLAKGKLMTSGGLWIAPSSGTGAGTQIITNTGNIENATVSNSSSIARKVSGTASISNSGFTHAFHIAESGGLSSQVRFTVSGTANSVVLGNDIFVLCQHYRDIVVESVSGFYTLLTVLIKSNGNEDYSVYLKTNHATAATVNIDVFPLNGETVTFTSTDQGYGGSDREHTHVCYPGRAASSLDNASNDYHFTIVDANPKIVLDKAASGESAIDFDNGGNIKARIALDSAETLQFKTGNTPALRMQITEAGVIQFNGAYTFPTSDGSNGQVLTTNGSGALSFTTVSGGSGKVDIGSGFANNRVLTAANSDTAQGESNLTFDGSTLTVAGGIVGTGSYHEIGNNTGAVSNDGSWNARLNIAGTSHARLDLFEDADDSKLRLYVHTGQDAHIQTTSNTPLELGTNSSGRVIIDNSGLNIVSGHSIRHNSTTVLDSSRNLTNIGSISHGSITSSDGVYKSDSVFAFLTTGNAAQNVRTKSVFCGTSYGDTPPAGSVNATTSYELNGSTVINSARGLTNITSGNMTGNLTIDYTGNATNDAALYIANDNNDWGIKIDKDSTATYGIAIHADGAHVLTGYNSSGTEKFRLDGNGHIQTIGNINNAGSFDGSSYVRAGRGSGGVALTINDGYGNANVTFNHQNGVPEQNGSSARIEANTDSAAAGTLSFEVSSAAVTNGTAVSLTQGLLVGHDYIQVPNQIRHTSDTDTYIQFTGNRIRLYAGGSLKIDTNNTYLTSHQDISGKANLSGATFTGDVQAPGLYVGASNTSFDFYNNGTSYLNGATTVDANLTISSGDLYIPEYIYHSGDTNTYIRMTTDAITLRGGGVDLLNLVEASTNFVDLGAELRMSGTTILNTSNYIGNIDRLYLDGNFSGTYLTNSSSDGTGYLQVQTSSGYVRIGPGNSTYSHFYTDRSKYYFNKPAHFDGGMITSHNEDFDIRRANSTSHEITLKENELCFADGYDLKMFQSSNTSGANIHMPRAGAMTFYGDTSVHHCIRSANQSNSEADDIMISSYGAIYFDLDSNNNNTSGADFIIGRHNSTSANLFEVDGENGQVISANDVTAFGSPSDIRLKENIEVIADPIEKVLKLRGVTFNYKDTGKKSTGLIAQDLEEVLPEVVYESHDINNKEDKFKAVRYGNTVGLLVEAIKEQQTIINRLEERIKKLEGEDNGD